jgi:hypothetical protein
MKRKKPHSAKARATPKSVAAYKVVVRRYRTMGMFQSRASLLRCLLRDARLERCVQMVP